MCLLEGTFGGRRDAKVADELWTVSYWRRLQKSSVERGQWKSPDETGRWRRAVTVTTWSCSLALVLCSC